MGPYRVESVISRGGMGTVYKARTADTGIAVAVKVAREPKRSLYASLRDEISILERARHPGVVAILDHDTSGADVWYAMELLEGETVESYNCSLWGDSWSQTSSRRRPASHAVGSVRPSAAAGRLDDVIGMFRALCEPLGFVHAAGIVHCDLKPANVFLRSPTRPVLMDFGLVTRARGAIDREELHAPGPAGGTLPYISPEVMRGDLPDARADLYAFGCMLYEALTGDVPFGGAMSPLSSFAPDAEPIPPSRLVEGVPAELERLVLGLLAKRREERIGDVEHVAAVLESLQPAESRPSADAGRGRRTAFLFRPGLAGRDDAMDEALALWWRASGGSGAFVLVAGESGIGKTFFASELSQRAAMNGALVITGECAQTAPGGESASTHLGGPLHAFRNVLVHVTDRCREMGAAETSRLLGDSADLLAEYEPGIAGLPGLPDLRKPVELPALAARERLVDAMTGVLRRLAATGTILLAIDDVQWADDLSLAVLAALREDFFEQHSFVLVGTYRTEEAGELIQQLTERPWTRTIRLRRLTEPEVGQVVADMLAMTRPPLEIVKHVHGQSEGVPFFVAEYLRAMAVERLIERRDGRWSFPPIEPSVEHAMAAIAFPARLAELLRRRLVGLSAETLRALGAAAVLGRRFDVRLLALVLGSHEESMHRCLESAVSREIVDRLDFGQYRFGHDKIRETLYADLGEQARRQDHGAAGRGMLALGMDGAGADARFGELASHFQAAGEIELAIEYLERAGRHALRYAADADAVGHFRQTIQLAASNPALHFSALRRAAWRRLLGEALQGLGNLNESMAPLSEAVALLGHPLPGGGVGWPVGIVREVFSQTIRRLAPSLAPAGHPQGSDTAVEAGRAFDRLQRAYFHAGRPVELLFANLSGLNLLERAPPTPELASALAHGAATIGFFPVGEGGLARFYFDCARNVLKEVPDPVVESYLEMLLALHHIGFGDWPAAEKYADRAIHLASAVQSLRAHDECVSVRVGIDLMRGRHEAAGGWVSKLEASARRRGDAQMLAWAFLQGATCVLLRGDSAVAHVAQVQPLLPSLARPEAIWFHALQANALVRAGRIDAARESASHAASFIDEGPLVQSYLVDAFGRLAETRLAIFARTRSQADALAARGACAFLGSSARVFRWAAPAAALHGGEYLYATGKKRAASKAWRKGLSSAVRMGLQYDEARLSLRLAYALRGRDYAERRALRDRATALLQSLRIPAEGPYPARYTS